MKKATAFWRAAILAAAAASAALPCVAAASTPPQAPRRVALVVQNHTSDAPTLPMAAFADTLVSRLSGRTFRVVNPHNVIGVNQNRTATGEAMPGVSAQEIGRMLDAEGVITATIQEFTGEDIGVPAVAHRLKVRLAINLMDAATGATVCGVDGVALSKNLTAEKVKADTATLYEGLMHAAASKAAKRLIKKTAAAGWQPAAVKKLKVFFGCNALGADIKIDGLAYGTAPAQLSVTPGFHSVLVSCPPYYGDYSCRTMFNQDGQTFKIVLPLTPEGEEQRSRALKYAQEVADLKKRQQADELALERQKLELEAARTQFKADFERKQREIAAARAKLESDTQQKMQELEAARAKLGAEAEKKRQELESERAKLEGEAGQKMRELEREHARLKAGFEKRQQELESQFTAEIAKKRQEFEAARAKLNAETEKKRRELEDAQKKLESDAERQRQCFDEMKKALDLGVAERSELFKRQLTLLDSMLGRYERSGDVDDYVRRTLAEGNSVYWQNRKGRVAITEGSAEEVKLVTPPAKKGPLQTPSGPDKDKRKVQEVLIGKPAAK